MSLILKGVDIPEKENQMYMMELYANGHCSVAKIEDGKCYELTIPSETEAVQIPKNHGNIIDESKAVVTETIDGYYEITAPTILEAEE